VTAAGAARAALGAALLTGCLSPPGAPVADAGPGSGDCDGVLQALSDDFNGEPETRWELVEKGTCIVQYPDDEVRIIPGVDSECGIRSRFTYAVEGGGVVLDLDSDGTTGGVPALALGLWGDGDVRAEVAVTPEGPFVRECDGCAQRAVQVDGPPLALRLRVGGGKVVADASVDGTTFGAPTSMGDPGLAGGCAAVAIIGADGGGSGEDIWVDAVIGTDGP